MEIIRGLSRGSGASPAIDDFDAGGLEAKAKVATFRVPSPSSRSAGSIKPRRQRRHRVGRQELPEREILEILDRERQRLGRELHDGLCQSLAGIAALSSALSRSLAASGQSEPAAAADEIVRLLNEAIGEARDLARGLSLIGVNDAGLVGGLKTLARNVSHAYRISCTFASDRRCPQLPREMQTHLMWIAQEAVRNAFAHGRADRVAIRVDCLDGSGFSEHPGQWRRPARRRSQSRPDRAAYDGSPGPRDRRFSHDGAALRGRHRGRLRLSPAPDARLARRLCRCP